MISTNSSEMLSINETINERQKLKNHETNNDKENGRYSPFTKN